MKILELAFLQMRKQDMDGTANWLNKIKNPETALTLSQQAYYYYLNGLMVIQKNMTQGEKLLKKALGINVEKEKLQLY